MERKRCFFIGHREASKEIYPALYATVERHIMACGVTAFIVGRYGGFDRLAALAVKEAKFAGTTLVGRYWAFRQNRRKIPARPRDGDAKRGREQFMMRARSVWRKKKTAPRL